MSDIATDFEPFSPPKPAIAAAPDVATEFEPVSEQDMLKELQAKGPDAELSFLDAKDGRLEGLSFDEWKRRRELLDQKSFWERHIVRDFDFAHDALAGMWDTVTGAAGEIGKGWQDRLSGKMGFADALKKSGSTLAEAATLGAVDFTDLVLGALRTIGTGVEYGRAAAAGEDTDKVGYESYKARLEARKYRAKIAKESAVGSAAGGATMLATGDAGAATDVQQGFAASRMANVSELAGMFSPTNPINIVPFGVGANAQKIGNAGFRGLAMTAENAAKAANFISRVTDIGTGVENLVRKASPGISDASAAAVRRAATGMAWTAAATAGLTSENDTVKGLAAAFTLGRSGMLAAGKASEFTAAVARAAGQGPRLQSALKRVARDPSVPEWAARTAAFLDKTGGTAAFRTARATAAGAATGGAITGALTAAGGADEAEIAGAIASGAVPGGLFGALGDAFARATGADRDMRINTERLLLAEAQRANGGDEAAKRFYALPESEQLAIGVVQAIMGPAATVELVSGDQFKARTEGKTGAGVWIAPNAKNGVGNVLINADAKRAKGTTTLHEFAHSLTMMEAPDEIVTAVRDSIKPEELKAFENDYLDRVVAAMRRSGELRDPNAATQYDDLGFPVRDVTGARDVEGDRAKARKKLVDDVGSDWLEHEFWAEKGAEMLAGADLAKMAETGEWEPRAARNLRLQQSVLRSAGVQFNADGTPIDGTFMGQRLSQEGEMALGQLLAKYVRDLADYAPRLNAEAKKIADIDAGKGPPTNFGKNQSGLATHPAFAKSWKTTAGGGKENDFATVSPDGTVQLKDPKVIQLDEMKRDAEINRLFPRNGEKADRSDPRVMRRNRDDGGEEVSGTVMPKEFYGSKAWSDQAKEKVKALETLMNQTNGETAGLWYHQIGSGSSGTWAAAVRKKLGNVRSTRREVRPISFLITQAGNLGVRVMDMMALKAKERDWSAGDKLGLWGGSLDGFRGDLKKMLANWAQGVPGDTGLGSAKHTALLDFLGKDDSKGGLIKTFRVDRMEDVAATGRTGFTFDYGKWKRREMNRENPQRPQRPDDGGSPMRESPDGQRPKRNIGMAKDEAAQDLTGGDPWPKSWSGILGRNPDQGQRGASGDALAAQDFVGRGISKGARPDVAARSLAEAAGSARDVNVPNLSQRQEVVAQQVDHLQKVLGKDSGQRLLDSVAKKNLGTDSGFEHNVWVYKDADGERRVAKATHSNRWGAFGDGTPASYLRRLALLNKLWPEMDIRVVGMAKDSMGRNTLVTDMAYVAGRELSPMSLRSEMLKRGWYDVGPDRFENVDANVLLTDATPENMRMLDNGRLVPIDVDVRPIELDKAVNTGMRLSPDDEQLSKSVARHTLMAQRGERAVNKVGVLTPEERTVLASGFDTVAPKIIKAAQKRIDSGKLKPKDLEKATKELERWKSPNALAELEQRARDEKKRFPVSKGWAPLELVGVSSSGELKWKQIPYEYNKSPEGKTLRRGTTEYKRRVNTIAGRMRDAIGVVYDRARAGDENAKKIISQASWYKGMRIRLRREFGGLGDLFADLLGATSPNTPVRGNWDYAVEALKMASNGDFDIMMPAWEQWVKEVDAKEADLRQYVEPLIGKVSKKDLKKDPVYVKKLEELKATRKLGDSLLPVRENGKKFGFNGGNVVRALVDLWRTVQNADPTLGIGDTAPKAQNFSGNLIGFKKGATIDMWAARMLQRLAGFARIPGPAEGGVSGVVRADGSTTLQFGFGQDVFHKAAELIRNDADMQNNLDLASVGDDDLQAIAWFLEKELWTENAWTNVAGEGGSFEFESDVAGVMDRARLKELRRISTSKKSSEQTKANALIEIDRIKREVDRYFAGLSIAKDESLQSSAFIPEDSDQAAVINRVHNAIYDNDTNDSVIGSKTASTLGRYGKDERSFDVEFVTRDGYDPSGVHDSMRQIGREADQDSIFLARSLRSDEKADPAFHRPGLEIYFGASKSGPEMQAALAKLDNLGAGFHTVVVDGRRNTKSRAGEMPPAVGVRILRLPEYDLRFGGDRSWLEMDDATVSTKMVEAKRTLDELADTIMVEHPDVSLAKTSWYEVRAEFRHEYDSPGKPAGQSGTHAGKAWSGRPVREAVAAADQR